MVLSVSLMLALVLSIALAAPKPARPPERPAPAPAPAPVAAPVRAVPTPARDGATALAELQSLYTALEYAEVNSRADQVLARTDLTSDQRLEVYRLQASAKAIVQFPADAEVPFRLLLRARPDYELPVDTAPKILAIFRKVQSEERALATQLLQVDRDRTIAALRLLNELPTQAQGGLPLTFSFTLHDPKGVVESVRVPYRREGQHDYSALALERQPSGEWRGLIAGDVTASEQNYALQYYLETADARGTLLTSGSAAAPRVVNVAAGQVPKPRFKPVPRAMFVGSAVLTSALGLAAGGLGISLYSTQRYYNQLVARLPSPAGSLVASQANNGDLLATWTNVAWISAATMLVVTLIFFPLTDF